MEKEDWKPFRNALDKKSERKEFDDMVDIPRMYISACSNSVQLEPLHPIIISSLVILWISSSNLLLSGHSFRRIIGRTIVVVESSSSKFFAHDSLFMIIDEASNKLSLG